MGKKFIDTFYETLPFLKGSTSKGVSVKINKELLKEFKTLIKQTYKIDHLTFINQFFHYGKLPDLLKIFQFYNFKYEEYEFSDESKTTSQKIRIDNYDSLGVERLSVDLSTYIRQLITFVVLHHNKTLEIFYLAPKLEYKNGDYSKFLDLIPQDIRTISEYFSYLALNDMKVLHERIEEASGELAHELLKMYYTDVEFEDLYVNGVKDKKYHELDELSKAQRLINKQEYKERNTINIHVLHIKYMKLVCLYIYKSVINKQKKIPDKYSQYRTKIRGFYDGIFINFFDDFYAMYPDKTITSIQKNLITHEFESELPFHEFILALIMNENEILRYIYTEKIDIDKLFEKDEKTFQLFGKHQIILRNS